MKVVMLAAHYPAEMPHFTRALAAAGAQVWAVGDVPRHHLPESVQHVLSGYLQVDNLLDEDRSARQLVEPLQRLAPDHIETLWEPLILLAGRLRDGLGLPGMGREEALVFRDKGLMKERLQAAGIRVPKSARASDVGTLREAVEDIGLPVIIKPIAGAGSRDTFAVTSPDVLEQVILRLAHVPEVLIEELIDGTEEFTFDTVCIDSVPVFESVAQYLPRLLESRSQAWISPAQVVFRDPASMPELAEGMAMGRAVLEVLKPGTCFTHMEWFRTSSGEVVFNEIAARAPGAKLVDMMNWANDFSVYQGWAEAVLLGEMREEPLRRHHVGCVFKRAQGQGRIRHIEGREAVHKALGEHLVEDALLSVGEPRRDWLNTLLSDGWIVARHPELSQVEDMIRVIIQELRLYAG